MHRFVADELPIRFPAIGLQASLGKSHKIGSLPGSIFKKTGWLNLGTLSGETKIAGWNIANRTYIFNPGPFSIAMLVYQSVGFWYI